MGRCVVFEALLQNGLINTAASNTSFLILGDQNLNLRSSARDRVFL